MPLAYPLIQGKATTRAVASSSSSSSGRAVERRSGKYDDFNRDAHKRHIHGHHLSTSSNTAMQHAEGGAAAGAGAAGLSDRMHVQVSGDDGGGESSRSSSASSETDSFSSEDSDIQEVSSHTQDIITISSLPSLPTF